ncbi:MAG: response regulator, partial [[Eubacterium] saphenum]|nr:response regulator [[Eubacterium] saphenum]
SHPSSVFCGSILRMNMMRWDMEFMMITAGFRMNISQTMGMETILATVSAWAAEMLFGVISPKMSTTSVMMKVDTATGALETIEKVKKVKYDIVFMDHMMPEVDGIETTHIIRRLIVGYEDVPIIALTANAIGGTKEMFLREGMNDFVAKPIEVTDIVAAIRRWLPKEKIIPAAVQKGKKSAEQKQELVIEGLNAQHALALLGSEKLYMQILKEYYLSIEKRAAIISDMLQKNDIKGYTIEVHSLKSTSRQIGADELADLAASLEKAGNEQNVDLIFAKTSDLIADFLEYKKILAPLFPDTEESSAQGTASIDDVMNLLGEMTEALDAFDTLQMDEVIEKMSKYTFSPEQEKCFGELKSAAELSDIEACAAAVEAWKKAAEADKQKLLTTPDEVKAVLEKTEGALEDFDTLLIDEAVEEMGKMHFPDNQKALYQKLKEAAEFSDIELCAKIVEEWKKVI